MSEDHPWKHLPVALPSGGMLPHLSGRLRTATVDAVFIMMGGVERLADWANKNPTDFYTKVWAKGMSKPITVEVQDENSLEGLLAALDAGEHAKVINEEGETFSVEDLVLEVNK